MKDMHFRFLVERRQFQINSLATISENDYLKNLLSYDKRQIRNLVQEILGLKERSE